MVELLHLALHYHGRWVPGWVPILTLFAGYDYAAIGNIISMPQYRERFGNYVGPTGNPENDYQFTAAWQSAIGQASNIGCIL